MCHITLQPNIEHYDIIEIGYIIKEWESPMHIQKRHGGSGAGGGGGSHAGAQIVP